MLISRPTHDPADSAGRPLFNVLATVAEFEPGLIRGRPRERMQVAKAGSEASSPSSLKPRGAT